MGASIEIRNPLEDVDWNDRLAACQSPSFFHTSNWARVLHETYGYKPVYEVLIENGELLAMVPLMEVRSFLTGRRGVALPFTDYCEPICTDKRNLQTVLARLGEYAREAKWKYVEFRGDGYFGTDIPCSGHYFGHILNLEKNETCITANMRDSTRRNISKALKSGVRVETATTLDAVTEFYRLHCKTRRMHGLPPQPFIFFRHIHEHVIKEDMGIVVLASFKDKPVAGSVFLHFGDRAFYKYGASDRKYQELRASNLVMWEGIHWHAERGYSTFCFGRTDPEAFGLRQFKIGWGATETNIPYHRYYPDNGRFLGKSEGQNRQIHRICSMMPVPVLKAIGSFAYRHMG